MQDLKKQGAYRALLAKMKEEAKALKEQIKKVRENIPHINFGKKRVEIGDKGQFLFYGLQKFPISLYQNQLNDIKQMINSPEFRKWAEENKDQLSSKTEEEKQSA